MLSLTNHWGHANQSHMRYLLTPVRMAMVKETREEMLGRMCTKGNPSTLLVGMEIGKATVENSIKVPLKLKIKLPYDPALSVLGIFPKEMKAHVEEIVTHLCLL